MIEPLPGDHLMRSLLLPRLREGAAKHGIETLVTDPVLPALLAIKRMLP